MQLCAAPTRKTPNLSSYNMHFRDATPRHAMRTWYIVLYIVYNVRCACGWALGLCLFMRSSARARVCLCGARVYYYMSFVLLCFPCSACACALARVFCNFMRDDDELCARAVRALLVVCFCVCCVAWCGCGGFFPLAVAVCVVCVCVSSTSQLPSHTQNTLCDSPHTLRTRTQNTLAPHTKKDARRFFLERSAKPD